MLGVADAEAVKLIPLFTETTKHGPLCDEPTRLVSS